MKPIKKISLGMIMVAGMYMTAIAQEATPSMVLQMRDGSSKAIVLDKNTRLSFTATSIVVSGKEGQIEFDRDKVYRYTSTLAPSGIGAVAAGDNVRVSLNGRSVILSGLQPGSEAILASLDGKRVVTAVADTNGSATLTAPDAAIFIVNAKGITFKFTAR